MNASSFFSVTHVSWHWMSSEWDASDSHLISLPLLHVQSSKPSCPGMMLTAAIPFRGQADRFKPSDRMVYDGLMASADEVIILSEYYYTRCFLDRDEFMVENASLLHTIHIWFHFMKKSICIKTWHIGSSWSKRLRKWRRRLNASIWTIKNTHILQKSSTAVRHLQLVINDYCQNV